MKTVTLGRTGITSPKNGFGALPVQRVTMDEAKLLLRRAYEAGFTFFDTARVYTDSEVKLGAALGGVRDRIHIASKTMASDGDGVRRDLDTTLKNLGTDYIDTYQFHNPAVCPRPGDGSGMYEAMEEAVRAGKVRHIGITNHRLHVAEEAVRSGLYETLQYPLSYLSSEKEIALVELCGRENVGFIAMKALSGGMITNSSAAYAWLNQYPGVLPIWGIQRMEELEEFISFFEKEPELDEELDAVIEADRSSLGDGFCRSCGYCMPCPMGIEIRTCARMSQLIRRSPSAPLLSDENVKMMKKAGTCIGCRKCVSRCPYGLDIPELLRRNLDDYMNIMSGKVKI